MSDFALDKVLKLGERVSPAQRTPECQALIDWAATMQDAEARVRATAAARKEAAAGGEPSGAPTEPEAFQGLVQFVRAVSLGAEAVGVGLCSAEVLGLLKEALLQPIIAKGADGKYEAHRPSVVCPQPSPTNVVQLLAAGVFLHVTANPEPAIAMLSAALSGVWPPPRPLQRRLVGAQFVPSAEAGEEGDEAGDAAAWSSSKGAAAASGSGSDAGGSKQTDAAAEAEAEAAKAPAALAAEVAAALFEHCPAVSAADLQKSALVLRLFLGCRAVGEQAADGPSFQAIVRTLLLDCQQLLALDPACMHAYVWAAQLILYARWPLDARRVAALFEEGTRRSKEARCWLAAGEVQHDWALWRLRGVSGEKNVAVRQAALLEAGALLDGVREAEEALAPWMPTARLAQLTERRKQLGALLKQLQAAQLRPSDARRHAARPAAGPAPGGAGGGRRG